MKLQNRYNDGLNISYRVGGESGSRYEGEGAKGREPFLEGAEAPFFGGGGDVVSGERGHFVVPRLGAMRGGKDRLGFEESKRCVRSSGWFLGQFWGARWMMCECWMREAYVSMLFQAGDWAGEMGDAFVVSESMTNPFPALQRPSPSR